MRVSFLPKPLSPGTIEIFNTSDLNYDLSIVQQPQNSRESTVRRRSTEAFHSDDIDQPLRCYKRLLKPAPVVVLKIFDSQNRNITQYSLGSFFITLSLVHENANKTSHLMGTTIISGANYCYAEDQGMVVFNINDIGISESGTHRLRINLFKSEAYGYFNGKVMSPKIVMLKEIRTQKFTVFRANEYYKEKAQKVIREQRTKMIRNFKISPMIDYLMRIKIVKYPSKLSQISFLARASSQDSSEPSTTSQKRKRNEEEESAPRKRRASLVNEWSEPKPEEIIISKSDPSEVAVSNASATSLNIKPTLERLSLVFEYAPKISECHLDPLEYLPEISDCLSEPLDLLPQLLPQTALNTFSLGSDDLVGLLHSSSSIEGSLQCINPVSCSSELLTLEKECINQDMTSQDDDFYTGPYFSSFDDLDEVIMGSCLATSAR